MEFEAVWIEAANADWPEALMGAVNFVRELVVCKARKIRSLFHASLIRRRLLSYLPTGKC